MILAWQQTDLSSHASLLLPASPTNGNVKVRAIGKYRSTKYFVEDGCIDHTENGNKLLR